jgi:hypothetical protein
MRPDRARATLSRYTYAAVGVVVAVLALVFASLIVATRGFHDEARSVSDAQGVLQTANQLQRTVIDVETGLRGYLLTGEDRFLQPFDAGLRSIPISGSRTCTGTSQSPISAPASPAWTRASATTSAATRSRSGSPDRTSAARASGAPRGRASGWSTRSATASTPSTRPGSGSSAAAATPPSCAAPSRRPPASAA